MRLHGLIERQSHSNRYRVTSEGVRINLFYVRAEARFFRRGLAIDLYIASGQAPRCLVKAGQAIDKLIEEVKMAA